jgi:hypothetical protein
MPRRLGGDAALQLAPRMVAFIVDVDGPNHTATDEWWAGERAKVEALFRGLDQGYCYRTRGGYRLCWSLPPDLCVLRTPEDKRRWSASYLDWLEILQHDHGIKGDPACKDAFRCYRLPRVRRDGVDVVPLDDVGDYRRLGVWRAPLCATDDPRVVRPPVELAPESAPPVEEKQLYDAADALAKAWPTTGRHAASLALCGALARLGWEDGAIAQFVDLVCRAATENPGAPQLGPEATYEKRLSQARSSAEKVARGEDVAGWGSLELAGVDTSALLVARRALGCGPDADMFTLARQAIAKPNAGQLMVEAIAKRRPDLIDDPTFYALCMEAAEFMAPRLATAEQRAKASPSGPPVRRGISARRLKAKNVKPPEYLVRGLITAGGVAIWSGEPKTGKSWDLIHTAVCVTSGQPVYGVHAVEKPSGVYLHFAEDDESSVRNRVLACAAGLPGLADQDGDWLDRLYLVPRGTQLDLLNDYEMFVETASVWAAEAECGVKMTLVGLDPLSDLHSGEEDKRDSMAPLMSRVQAWSTGLSAHAGTKVTVGLVHHAGKANADKSRKRGGQSMRGSSVIHASLDCGLHLRNPRGDGKNEFVSLMENEIKAARGAGSFDRVIKIEDDDDGHARVVRFTTAEPQVGGEEMSKLARERVADVVRVLFLQDGAPLTQDQILAKIRSGGGTGKKTILGQTLDLAIADGLVQQLMNGKNSQGYVLTDAGREFYRNGGGGSQEGGEQAGQSGPPPPPGSALGMLGEHGRA